MNAALLGDVRLPLAHCALDLDCASDGIDDAGKLHQQTVARGLDDASVVLGDLGVNQLGAMGLLALNRPGLVCLHEPAIADHIGGEDRDKLSGDALLCHAASQRTRMGTKSLLSLWD